MVGSSSCLCSSCFAGMPQKTLFVEFLKSVPSFNPKPQRAKKLAGYFKTTCSVGCTEIQFPIEKLFHHTCEGCETALPHNHMAGYAPQLGTVRTMFHII
jgi:hypothetical protein